MENKEDTKQLKTIDDYITPVSEDMLLILKERIEMILNFLKVPHEDNDSIFILPDILKLNFSIKTQNDPNNIQSNQNFILDCSNFYYTNEENKHQLLNHEIFTSLIEKLKDRGTLIVLMDYNNIKYLCESLKPMINNNNNLLIKLFLVEKCPLLGILSMQKFKFKADFENLKVLLHETYDTNSITKPLTVNINNLYKSMKYINEIFQYQGYLRELHPGTILRINIKETFWSDNVDFTLTVIDSPNQEMIKKNECKAVIVSKSYSNDFLYISREGNLQMCEKIDTSRLILIRCNVFNLDDTEIIKDKLSHYILLFKFTNCVNDKIPILLLTNQKGEEYEVYRDKDILIIDVIENENKDTFRQLIFLENPNEIQSEIKLILTSKNKVKTDNSYIPLPTIDKYSQKNLKTCLDEDFICSYYIKCVLSGIFFNKFDLSKENLSILILGAGIGTINHFFNKFLNGKTNITSIEINNNITELGSKYFGFKNDNKNYSWEFLDANSFLKKEYEKGIRNKYDIVVIDINNTNTADGISPPPIFFETSLLTYIKELMKESGVYIINLMTRSYNSYSNALKQLESIFDLVLMVENNEDLNKIHYCFKKKLSNEEYIKLYQLNYDSLSVNADVSIVENDYKKILSKVTDINDLKVEINSKI